VRVEILADLVDLVRVRARVRARARVS